MPATLLALIALSVPQSFTGQDVSTPQQYYRARSEADELEPASRQLFLKVSYAFQR